MVWEYRQALLKGLSLTLALTACAAVLGLISGTVLAIASQTSIAPLRWIVAAFVEIWRNTPLLVQLIWIHFALPLVTGINTTALESGVIGITLQAQCLLYRNSTRWNRNCTQRAVGGGILASATCQNSLDPSNFATSYSYYDSTSSEFNNQFFSKARQYSPYYMLVS